MSGFFQGDVIHVCLDDKSLKMLKTAYASGKPRVAAVHFKSVEGLGAVETAQEIRNGLAAMKTSSRRVVFVLPSRYAITKNIEVPSLDPAEIEDIIRLQAVRHTPYSKEEVIVSHLHLERILERYTKVLLVIVSNDNVHKKTDILEAAGCEIEAVRLSAEALVKLVHESRPFADEESPCGLVSVDRDSTDFIIVHRAKPYFIRSIPAGSEQLDRDVAGTVGLLVEEFKKTCEAYQAEDQGVPLKRFVISGTNLPSQLAQGVQDAFAVETETLDVFAGLSASAEARVAMTSAPTSFLDAAAASFMTASLEMNLLPGDLKVRKSFREKGKEIFTAAIFAIVIVALILGVFLTKIYFRNEYLSQISGTFETRQKEASELEAISEETRQVRDFQKKRGIGVRVIDEFQNVLPQEMYLSEISSNDEGRVSIKGTSKLMSTVFSFVTELENSRLFQGVTSDYAKSRKENDQDVSDFGLSAGLEGWAVAPKPVESKAAEPAADSKKKKES